MNTVLAADRVLLLDQGRVAGLGEPPASCCDDNALYAERFYALLSEHEAPVRRPQPEEVAS